MGKQPGVMLYFDIRPSLNRLSDGDKGRLFEAILDYGQYGALPDFDGVLGVAWDFIQPKLDRDRERYEEISQKRADAIRIRWDREREKKDDPNNTNEYTCIPTTTTTTKTKTTSPSKTASAPTRRGSDDYFNRRRNELLAQLDQQKP